MDARVLEQDRGLVKRITEPGDWPGSPTLKVKGIAYNDPMDYSRASGEITFTMPLSQFAIVEVFDGGSLVWQWTGAAGDTVGS